MTLEDFLSEWNNDSDRVLVHTSGSTGKPKPMMVEKKRMLNSARITCDFLGLKPGDSALLCMSLDYIAGKMVVVRSIERHLHLISVSPSGHPLKDVNEEITFAAMVPMQVYNTLQIPEERERLSHIRHLIIGGGAIDAALEKELKSFPGNIAIWSTYGMTDTQNAYSRVRVCAQARAIENECYVAIAGSVGNLPRVHNMDIQYAQSAVFTPCDFAFPNDGKRSEATPNTEMILVSDVDLNLLNELHTYGAVRNLRDRRKDLYELKQKK